jgi:DNA-binding MarR family transcriptional regulator
MERWKDIPGYFPYQASILGRIRELPRGERNHKAKLTKKEVEAIRRLYDSDRYDQYELADRYGVTQSMISCIIRHANWT